MKKAKLIVCAGMLYDLDSPDKFIADVARVLAPDGVFVAQLMCARQMLESNDIGNLTPEHLLFFTLRSLDFLFSRHGLELFDIEENTVNGGSYRLFVRHYDTLTPTSRRLYHFRIEEYRAGLHHPDVYLEFFRRAEENKRACMDFVKGEFMRGKRVWILGASTKGSLIAQYYGLDSSVIEGASERSPEKVGKFVAGTGVPIFAEEDMRRAKPDYAVLLPYAFKREIIERELVWLEGGGKMILPLPTFRVVGKEALTTGGA